MIYISQESLNFFLSDKSLTFQRSHTVTITENIQDGCQWIIKQTKIINKFGNIAPMAKLKRPQHSLSQDHSEKSFFMTIPSILLKFLKIRLDDKVKLHKN